MLTNNIYSHDGQHLLIPAGAKVLGETKRVEGFGQTRLSVAFHRLIMPAIRLIWTSSRV
jgi:type IV secretion system protein VirB10